MTTRADCCDGTGYTGVRGTQCAEHTFDSFGQDFAEIEAEKHTKGWTTETREYSAEHPPPKFRDILLGLRREEAA